MKNFVLRFASLIRHVFTSSNCSTNAKVEVSSLSFSSHSFIKQKEEKKHVQSKKKKVIKNFVFHTSHRSGESISILSTEKPQKFFVCEERKKKSLKFNKQFILPYERLLLTLPHLFNFQLPKLNSRATEQKEKKQSSTYKRLKSNRSNICFECFDFMKIATPTNFTLKSSQVSFNTIEEQKLWVIAYVTAAAAVDKWRNQLEKYKISKYMRKKEQKWETGQKQ